MGVAGWQAARGEGGGGGALWPAHNCRLRNYITGEMEIVKPELDRLGWHAVVYPEVDRNCCSVKQEQDFYN